MRQRFTNAEWMDLIYPTNEDLPYMYDKFDWKHCRYVFFEEGKEGYCIVGGASQKKAKTRKKMYKFIKNVFI